MLHIIGCFNPIVMNTGKFNRYWSCMLPITNLFCLANNKGEVCFQSLYAGPCVFSLEYTQLILKQLNNPALLWQYVWYHWHECLPSWIHRPHLNSRQILTAAVTNYSKLLYLAHGISIQADTQPFPHCFSNAQNGRFVFI